MIEAVVFDMDGVLIDSEPVWEEVRREFVAALVGTATNRNGAVGDQRRCGRPAGCCPINGLPPGKMSNYRVGAGYLVSPR